MDNNLHSPLASCVYQKVIKAYDLCWYSSESLNYCSYLRTVKWVSGHAETR